MEQNYDAHTDAVGGTPNTKAELEELREKMRDAQRPVISETDTGAPLAPDPRPGGGKGSEIEAGPTEVQRLKGREEIRRLRAGLKNQQP